MGLYASTLTVTDVSVGRARITSNGWSGGGHENTCFGPPPPFFLSWPEASSGGAADTATSAAANSPAQAINLRVTLASGYSSSLSPLPPFFFGGGTAFGSYFGFGVGIWAFTAFRYSVNCLFSFAAWSA